MLFFHRNITLFFLLTCYLFFIVHTHTHTHTPTMYKEPFRIKQLSTGNCWAPESNLEKIKTTSSCRDVFQLLDDSRIEHVVSQKRVHFYSNTFEVALTSSHAGNAFLLANNTIVEQRVYHYQICYTEEDGKIMAGTTFEIATRFCYSNTSRLVKLLPGNLD